MSGSENSVAVDVWGFFDFEMTQRVNLWGWLKVNGILYRIREVDIFFSLSSANISEERFLDYLSHKVLIGKFITPCYMKICHMKGWEIKKVNYVFSGEHHSIDYLKRYCALRTTEANAASVYHVVKGEVSCISGVSELPFSLPSREEVFNSPVFE